MDRAVQALEAAHRRAPGSAAILNDLAAAYAARGERDQALLPMLQALDAVERAVAADSTLLPALFNRALIVEQLYLYGSARNAWTRYRAAERDPRWRAEADAHLRQLDAVREAPSWTDLALRPPAAIGGAAAIRERVGASPQAAREGGYAILREWAAAAAAGDTVRARRLLAVAREIGDALGRAGLDHGVALAVAAIDGTAQAPARARQIARGHLLLGEGIQLFQKGRYDPARDTLLAAERALAAAGSPAVRWAIFYRGAAALNGVRYAEADRLLARVAARAGPHEPALAGKTLLALGLSQLRRGNHDAAIRYYRRARPYLDRSRETENRGSVAVMLSEALGLVGQLPPAHDEAYRALRLLSPYRSSNFLNNHLAIAATYARGERLPYAALALTGEMVGVARLISRPNVVALALCTRARDLLAMGRNDAAEADVAEAVRWAAQIGGGRNGDRLRANVALARGQLMRARDPQAALPVLAEAARTYGGFGNDLYLSTALYEAAMAAQTSGDTASARRWLIQAIKHIDRQRSSFTQIEVLASFSETVENVFDAMIGIELAQGRPASAFAHLERSRVSPWQNAARSRAMSAATVTPRQIAAGLPADALLAEYAVLDDRLVIWTAARGRWHVQTVAVPRDSLAALVETYGREAGRTNADALGLRSRLYELLVRPFAAELSGIRSLHVVPDRELGRLPFAALWDAAAGRYVVQTLQVNTLPSATFVAAASRPRRRRGEGAPALVVGNPALDTLLVTTLEPLPAAEREAAAVARLYPRAALLTGAAATRDSVVRLLERSSIFHFAGHAVFNADQPERSFLALAGSGGEDGGALRAEKIGELRPTNLGVVVLSACSSLTPRASHTGAVAGLAYSFLRAGAPATISTLWDVDDAVTMPLLVDFHRRLASGTPAPEALRLAQLGALRSGVAELSAPATWAAFVYTGP
ncbi:MAG TPA: CHAT domain-containing protein [Longimicrobium sp.]